MVFINAFMENSSSLSLRNGLNNWAIQDILAHLGGTESDFISS